MGKLLYEGKAKRIFETEAEGEVLMYFKDDATAFNGEKKEEFEHKGRINKALTLSFLKLLEREGIETHFVRDIDERSMIVKKVEIIPLEVVVRNWVAGSLARRLGQSEGTRLDEPLVEFYYKRDDLNDPMINNEHILALKLATVSELEDLRRQSIRINYVLYDFFNKIGIRLVDFKLEFGRVAGESGKIILADEISPDTCRLWDIKTGERLDKDRFRRDMGRVMESYGIVLERVSDAVPV